MTRWERLRRRLQRAWRRARRFEPGQVNAAAEYRIDDGVDYSQPLIIPYAVKHGGPAAAVRFLHEATQAQTMRDQFGSPYRSQAYDGPISMPTEDPLEEWAFETRRAVLTNCHAAFQRNPLAKQAVNLLRQFAVGKGMSLTCRNQDVQAVLDEFTADPENNVKEYEKTLLQDLAVDGELFIRRFSADDGRVVIAPIPPWHITEIRTEPGFFRRVLEYHLQYTTTNQTTKDMASAPVDEWIPADEILHVALNRHSYELRGRPDLFVILPWLRAFKEWLENRARQNKFRNGLLWDVTIAGATAGAVANAAARYHKPPTDGSVVVHSDKETWKPLTNSVGAGDASEDGRQIKLNVAVGMGLPEYMLSDGQNANLASATAQQLPALWRFIDAQQVMAEQVWTPIFKWVLQAALDAGRLADEVDVQDPDGDPIRKPAPRRDAPEPLPDGTLPDAGPEPEGEIERVKTLDAFEVTFPELSSDDPKTIADAMAVATVNGWVSDEGATSKIAPMFGLDPALERKRMAREEEERAEKVGQGVMITPQSIGVPPEEMMRGNGNGRGMNGNREPDAATPTAA